MDRASSIKVDWQETSLRGLDVRPGRHDDDVATDATDGDDGPEVILGPSY
jgi:hypothetical protein